MIAVVVAVVIMGALIGWEIQAAANQICRQVFRLHARMDEIYYELTEANRRLSSIEQHTANSQKPNSTIEEQQWSPPPGRR